MSDYIDILEELRKESSTNKKIDILKNNKTNKELREYLDLALNKKIRFNIAKIPSEVLNLTSEPTFIQSNSMAWVSFKDLAERLFKREITGNEAISEVISTFKDFSSSQRFWLANCLLKDLACVGIGQTIVGAAFDEQLKFKLMLAEEAEVLDSLEENTQYFCQKKMNGVRTIVIIEDGRVGAIYGGRNGLIANNFYFLSGELEKLALDAPVKDFVLEGEVHVNDCLEDTMTLYGTDMNKTESDFIGKTGKILSSWKIQKEKMEKALKFREQAKFVIFDLLSLVDWNEKTCDTELIKRQAALDQINKSIQKLELKQIEIVPSELYQTKTEAIDAAQKWINVGMEGGIVKLASGFYEWKRSKNWVKVKERCEIDVEIVGFEISKTKFNPDGSSKSDMLGKFIVKDKAGAIFGIGTGKYLSEDKRIEVWENQDQYLGKILQCSAQRSSKNSYACPRVDLLREDRSSLED